MSTHQNLLTAAPLAFLLILPVLCYYCLRNLFSKQEHFTSYLALDTRIPEYLIKQHVDKTRSVRKQYKKLTKKRQSIKSSRRVAHNTRNTQLKTIQNLGVCAVGLQKYAQINSQIQQKYAVAWKQPKNIRKAQRRIRRPVPFQPTILTIIYQQVEY